MTMISLFLISLLLFNLVFLGLVFKKIIKSNNLLELVLVFFILYTINISLYYVIINIFSFDFSVYTLNLSSNQLVSFINPNSTDPVRL